MFGLGMPELIFIFLVIFLLFGGKKLPEIAKGLGKSIREFKGELTSMKKDVSSIEENTQTKQETNIT